MESDYYYTSIILPLNFYYCYQRAGFLTSESVKGMVTPFRELRMSCSRARIHARKNEMTQTSLRPTLYEVDDARHLLLPITCNHVV